MPTTTLKAPPSLTTTHPIWGRRTTLEPGKLTRGWRRKGSLGAWVCPTAARRGPAASPTAGADLNRSECGEQRQIRKWPRAILGRSEVRVVPNSDIAWHLLSARPAL